MSVGPADQYGLEQEQDAPGRIHVGAGFSADAVNQIVA